MRRVLILALAASAMAPLGVGAVPILDQENDVLGLPNSTSGVGGTVMQAQTFTVGLTGTLVQLDVLGVGGGTNLFMDIRATNGSQPSDTVVLQTVNVGALAGSSAYTSIALNTSVTAGDFLAFVFYFTGSGSASLLGAASSIDPYTGGGLWTSGNPPFGGGSWYPNGNSSSLNFDLGFRTYVAQVPEPTTLSLLGAGLIAFGLIRRRRGIFS